MSEVTKAKFDKAVQIVKSLPKEGPVQTTSDDLLFFYRYYKQATIGDVNTAMPGIWAITDRAKWKAWESVKGTTAEVCYKMYVEKLIELLKKAGEAGDSKSLEMVKEIEAA